jgi:hypothetical protein
MKNLGNLKGMIPLALMAAAIVAVGMLAVETSSNSEQKAVEQSKAYVSSRLVVVKDYIDRNIASARTETRTLATAAGENIQERVMELPEDGGRWHTTLYFTGREDSASRHVAYMFASNPKLQSLISQTQYHEYYPGDKYAVAWLPTVGVGRSPAIVIQDPMGKPVFKAEGAQISSDARVLAAQIQQKLSDCRPGPRPTPTPSPTPAPTPGPVPPPDLGPAPTPPPEVKPEDNQKDLWVLVGVLCGLAGAAALWTEFSKKKLPG